MSLTEIPMSFPQWDSKNPSGSFQLFSLHIHEQSKQYLVKDGFHTEMLFFMPMDGKGKLVSWQGDDRDYLAQWIRDYISKHYIFGLVHVCEAWVRLADSPKDHTLKQIIAGEMKVSEMKPEHRKEALTVSAQSRNGWSVSWIDEMIRDKEKGTLKLGESHQFSDFQGRFGKLFG